MTCGQGRLTYCTLLIGISLILGGCDESYTPECNAGAVKGQCVDADELWAALARDSIENTSGADCPSISQLNESVHTSPYDFQLHGSDWKSGPEGITTDGRCCYTTAYACM
ncbi:MAG: hypothetical protein QM784_22310 [Polyangiaceae bacterium]